MPELPDITLYTEALRRRVERKPLDRMIVKSPFLVRTFEPAVDALEGRAVVGIERIGKQIVFAFEGEHFLALHLMIAGRLLWKKAGVKPAGKIDLAALWFGEDGTLVITEASQQKRAAVHVVAGRAGLAALDRGGLDPVSCSLEAFSAALLKENRTLKRVLTSPAVFSGIGNAYSDEILHAARLSPIRLTSSLKGEEIERLWRATRETLVAWTGRLLAEFGLDGDGPGRFPGVGEITAFRPGFAVHGRYGLACPACGTAVQRIVRASNEVNYCPGCQTDGVVLADRLLSRLLKDEWPRTVEEWEAEVGGGEGEGRDPGRETGATKRRRGRGAGRG